MKWIHQLDSAFSSIVMYSPTDHFVAFAEAHNYYSYNMGGFYDYYLTTDEIRERLTYWFSHQNSDLVRVIAASGELRRMLRDLEPSLFL